jgi:hypothetical protein
MNSNASRPGGERFPCASLAEALPHLRRPPTPAAVRFKIQDIAEQTAQVAAYVDARHVFDRLTAPASARESRRGLLAEVTRRALATAVDRVAGRGGSGGGSTEAGAAWARRRILGGDGRSTRGRGTALPERVLRAERGASAPTAAREDARRPGGELLEQAMWLSSFATELAAAGPRRRA